MDWDRRRMLAEALGTFLLVFFGTGAIVVNDVSNGAITHLGISIVFGLIVLAMIVVLGEISGSHMNPAVTLGLYAARKMEGRKVVPYIVSQSVGAILASSAIWTLFPVHPTLGATMPAGSAAQAFVFELTLTFVLMFAVLRLSDDIRRHESISAVVIGSIIAIEAMIGGPVSGASMNPARSLGPAVVSQNLTSLWIYLTAPILGALIGVAASKLLGTNTPKLSTLSKDVSS